MPIVLVFRVSIIKYYKLSCLSNINLLSHSSRGWKFEVKVFAGLVASKAARETVSCLSPAFGGLLVIFGFSWLVEASP